MRITLQTIRRGILWAAGLSAAYGLLSFSWSLLGFLTPVPPVHFHEYLPRILLVEVGGHILFGLAAGVPTLDFGLILLCGGEAIMIDTDHLLGALQLPVLPRLSHSIGFMVLGPIFSGWVSRNRIGFRQAALVTFASILAHISYDVYAGDASIPLFDPASISFYVVPYWTWLPIEVVAFVICAYVGLDLRKRRKASV